MRKLLVATHGYLANGYQSSLKILTGKEDEVHFINAYVSTKDVDEQIQDFFKTVDKQDEVIIFTDLFGGSVNQKMIPYVSKTVYLIAGFNLPLLLQILLTRSPMTMEALRQMIEDSRKEIKLFEKEETSETSEKDFFN